MLIGSFIAVIIIIIVSIATSARRYYHASWLVCSLFTLVIY